MYRKQAGGVYEKGMRICTALFLPGIVLKLFSEWLCRKIHCHFMLRYRRVSFVLRSSFSTGEITCCMKKEGICDSLISLICINKRRRIIHYSRCGNNRNYARSTLPDLKQDVQTYIFLEAPFTFTFTDLMLDFHILLDLLCE